MSGESLVLGGRYSLGRILGQGGMAEVFLAEDKRLHRTVAVKVLRSDLARDDSFQERFRREAQSAAALNHPSIVAVYDTGEEHHTTVTGAEVTIPYIVMEYVRGTTLREHIDPEHPMDPHRAGEIMAALLSALEYSHRSGIVHRDIKPGNVMITDAGTVKVMDFGIARAVADATSAMTATQAVMGTAQYLSPEQARGQLVDARSDIYSASCVFYEMLTGRPPFTGDTPVSIAYQHVREHPVAPSAINPSITPALDAVILTGLTKDREQRYPSAVALSRDIAAAVAGREPKLVDGAVPVGAATGPGDDTPATTVLGPVGDETEALPAVTSAQAAVPAGAALAGAGAAGAASGPATGQVTPRSADEVQEDERRKPWWLIALVVLAVLAVLGVLLWFWQPWAQQASATVAVPTLQGQTQDEAAQSLEEAGLKGKYTQEASADVDEDTVISSDPGAGQEVAKGSTVNVVVSSGPAPVDVPDLTGKSSDDARAALEEVGLTMTVAGEEDAVKAEAGTVTRSSPQAGSSAMPGDEVQVWVATGSYTVPSVEGLTEEEATKRLEDIGFQVETTEAESSDATAGTVTDQTPPKDSSAKIGATIQLTIATAPGPVAVPNVTGRSYEDAKTILEDAGFGVERGDTESSDSIDEGSVIRTDPQADEKVDAGSTITVIVSTGPEATPTPTPTTEEPTTEAPTTETPTTEEPTTADPTTTEAPTTTSNGNNGNGNGNGNGNNGNGNG